MTFEYVRHGEKSQLYFNINVEQDSLLAIIVKGMINIITQIYEVQTPYEAEKLIGLGVNHIGSVIVSEEAFKISSIKETIELIRGSASKSTLIPLFSNTYSVLQVLDYYQPDIIHFCEDLMNIKRSGSTFNLLINLQENIKKKFPEVLIMRSIPIPPAGITDFVSPVAFAKIFEKVSDFFLTDTFLMNNSSATIPESQPVQGFVGITGQTCDWESAKILVDSTRIPVILAGGLSPDNVLNGIIKVKPAGVDSCTLTNECDIHGKPVRFKKDFMKVKRFIEESDRAEILLANRAV